MCLKVKVDLLQTDDIVLNLSCISHSLSWENCDFMSEVIKYLLAFKFMLYLKTNYCLYVMFHC